ncbi:MAG: hypothetical protein ACYC6M_16735, partial [Terriglobales bacterium]
YCPPVRYRPSTAWLPRRTILILRLVASVEATGRHASDPVGRVGSLHVSNGGLHGLGWHRGDTA